MKQRVPRMRWDSPVTGRHRPRVLIEDDRPSLALSDFAMFHQAGFDVAFCSGPGRDPRGCPLLRGEECEIVAGADVVLHGLDPALGVAAAIRRQHPAVPVVVEQRRPSAELSDTAPTGCIPLPFSCSVKGQVEALTRALVDRPTGWDGGSRAASAQFPAPEGRLRDFAGGAPCWRRHRTVTIWGLLPLAQAAEAHRILEGGHAGGKIVLVVEG